MDFLLDDCLDNIQTSPAKYPVLFTQPWNMEGILSGSGSPVVVWGIVCRFPKDDYCCDGLFGKEECDGAFFGYSNSREKYHHL